MNTVYVIGALVIGIFIMLLVHPIKIKLKEIKRK